MYSFQKNVEALGHKVWQEYDDDDFYILKVWGTPLYDKTRKKGAYWLFDYMVDDFNMGEERRIAPIAVSDELHELVNMIDMKRTKHGLERGPEEAATYRTTFGGVHRPGEDPQDKMGHVFYPGKETKSFPEPQKAPDFRRSSPVKSWIEEIPEGRAQEKTVEPGSHWEDVAKKIRKEEE